MAGISGRTLVGPFKGRKKRKRRSQVLSTLFFAAVFLCLLFFLLGLGYANAAPTNTNTNNSPPGLFGRPAMMLDSSASGSGGEVTNNPVAAQSALVSVDTSLLGAKGPGAIALNMFGKTLVAQRHSVKVTGNNRTEWVGTIQGQQLSSVVLIADQGKLAGSVKTVDEAYEVDVKGRGMSALVELDWRSFPPEAHPKEGEHNDVAKGSTGSLLLKRKSKSLERRRQIVPDPRSSEPAPPAAFFESRYPPPRPSKHKRQSPSSPDATSTYEVHVMVLYTTAARIASGGTSAMLTKIDLAISLANQAYLNSNVSQTLKLVYAQEVWDYDEQGMSADLNRLVDPSDGYMDDIHALRDLYAADLVSLFIEDMTYCGIAYLMRNPSTTFAPLGFSVVNYWCATGAYTFAHELGHNMGCAHDRANSAVNDGAYDYSFGYQEPSAKWRTIMAYNCAPTSCPRILYFSNPNITYNGDALGIAETNVSNSADNAKTLNLNAPYVGAFRDALTYTPTTFTRTTTTSKTTTSRFTSTSRTTSTSFTRTTATPGPLKLCTLAGLSILDKSSVISTMEVPITGISASFTVDLDIVHSYLGDLTINLTRLSDGTTVKLYQAASASCHSLIKTRVNLTFDGNAASIINTPCTGTTWKPDNSMASLLNSESAGVWSLGISDGYSLDTGYLYGWCLNVVVPGVVPNGVATSAAVGVVQTTTVTKSGTESKTGTRTSSSGTVSSSSVTASKTAWTTTSTHHADPNALSAEARAGG